MTEADIAVLTQFAVVAFVFSFVAAVMISQLDVIQPQLEGYSPSAGEAIDTTQDIAQNLDYIVPLIVILGGVVAIGLAYYVNVSPMFLPLSIFYMLFVLIGAYVMSSLGAEFVIQVEANSNTTWPLTGAVFNNLFNIAVIYAVLMGIALYAKPFMGGQAAGRGG